jgi:hypothetical protein
MKWDGIPHLTMLGKAPFFLIYCLSARTARRSLAPPRRRSSSFRHIISNNSVPLVSLKNRRGGKRQLRGRTPRTDVVSDLTLYGFASILGDPCSGCLDYGLVR